MSSFIRQYGMLVMYAIIGLLITGILFGVFQDKWKSAGVVEDGIKADYSEDSMTYEKPVLLADNQKVNLGETVRDARIFAGAKDIDEQEIELSKISIREVEGTILQEDYSLKTDTPTKSVLEFKVTGKNGNTASRRIVVLVD
ncbi:MAG: hypothetical protein LBR68_06610 [Lachnoclostridium sp.]|jgi:hypothetical protein|nr:hypothetical protein [Lachnoclostridium sp.]